MKTKELYVGKNKVEDVNIVESVNLVSVLYENGKSEDFTAEQYDALISEAPYEDGEISMRKYTPLIKRIIEELVNARCDINSYNWVIDKVDSTIRENAKQAQAKKWGVLDISQVLLAEIHAELMRE